MCNFDTFPWAIINVYVYLSVFGWLVLPVRPLWPPSRFTQGISCALCVHCCSNARFITVSTANWTDQMDHFWSATSSLVTIYFVSLILIGSYFALNLVLVRAGRSGVL